MLLEPFWNLAEGSAAFLEALGGPRRLFLAAKTIFCDFEMILERFLGAQMCSKTGLRGKKCWSDFRC